MPRFVTRQVIPTILKLRDHHDERRQRGELCTQAALRGMITKDGRHVRIRIQGRWALSAIESAARSCKDPAAILLWDKSQLSHIVAKSSHVSRNRFMVVWSYRKFQRIMISPHALRRFNQQYTRRLDSYGVKQVDEPITAP